MPVLILLALVLVALVVLIPISIVQRYRVGTSRRRARGWLATVNVVGIALSAASLLIGAAVTNMWVPRAFLYTAGGLTAGIVLGGLGLLLTRWEPGPSGLHYTPNRLLVLGISLVVAARIAYGFWRGWESTRAGVAGGPWLVTWGVAESMAAGALVIGYYLAYWIGVRHRFRRHG